MTTLLTLQLVHNPFTEGFPCGCATMDDKTAHMVSQLKSLLGEAGWTVKSSGVQAIAEKDGKEVSIVHKGGKGPPKPCGKSPAMHVRRGRFASLWVCPEHYRADVDTPWTQEAESAPLWVKIREPGR